MRLDGMVTALEEQRRQNGITELDFEERLALLVDRQWLWRENRSLAAQLKNAQLKIANASLEDINYRHPRGLKRAQIEQLRASAWIKEHRNCIITGPTGIGKSYLACALGHQACRDSFRTGIGHCMHASCFAFAGKKKKAPMPTAAPAHLLKSLARLDLFVIDS
ncbi:MAG: ATP-binding protein [Verrucomicrobiota bacterium]